MEKSHITMIGIIPYTNNYLSMPSPPLGTSEELVPWLKTKVPIILKFNKNIAKN